MQIIGKLDTVIFENNDNNYKIIVIQDENGNKYTLLGYLNNLDYALLYEFDCLEVNNPRYGLQYKINTCKIIQENNATSIINYLTSTLFKGVGLIAAEAVYQELGDNALELIAKDPSVLDRVKKLSEKQKSVIYNGIIQNKSFEETFITLNNLGFSNALAGKIYEKYQGDTLDIISNHPYQLIYDFEGVGFIRADDLAMKVGISLDNEERIMAALIYSFMNVSQNYGLTYLTEAQLISTTSRFLSSKGRSILEDTLKNGLNAAIKDEKLIQEANKIYLPYLFYDEVTIAKRIHTLMEQKPKKLKMNLYKQLIKDFENINQIELEKTQLDAIYNALMNSVSIITGGPGTGKTTIIKAIINLYSALNGYNLYDDEAYSQILLCAPTGKAAKRINEKTLFKASTIHKALGYNFDGEWFYSELNQLPHNLIIIDEASMVDNNLASHLLKAIKPNAKVVFVGDIFQLPSISPGAFLKDLIESEEITTTYLETIFRQRKNSNIIKLSSMVKDGNIDSMEYGSDDLEYIPAKGEEVANIVLDIMDAEIANGRDLYNDISVLVPMYKTLSGIDNLNRAISDHFINEPSFSFEYKEKIYKEQDKIMCLVNSSDWGLMNGDMGILSKKKPFMKNDKPHEGYEAVFDDIKVNLVASDFDSFTLSYATSVHKGQGAEYKVVIFVINNQFRPLLKRKLIYTAVSRASEKLYIVGDINALKNGLSFIEEERQTSLKERLKGKYQRKILINDKDIPFEYLGEEMPDGITPYYFMD